MDSQKRPKLKLSIAFAGICWLLVSGTWSDWHSADFTWNSWALPALQWGLAGWYCCYLLQPTGSMHLLFGWTCLILGLASLGSLVLGWSFLPLEWSWMNVGALGLPVTGWLLVIDRDVALYRAHLRELEHEHHNIRLEKEHL